MGGNNEGETEVELTTKGSTFVGRKCKEVEIGSSRGQEKKTFGDVTIVQG